MNKDFVKGITFEINEKKRLLGTMRIDWYDGKLCNQWNPTNLIIELKTVGAINLGKLQKELNFLQFELLSSFQRVENYCGGNGYDREIILSFSSDYADYAVRAIPVREAYSYIYVYSK